MSSSHAYHGPNRRILSILTWSGRNPSKEQPEIMVKLMDSKLNEFGSVLLLPPITWSERVFQQL